MECADEAHQFGYKRKIMLLCKPGGASVVLGSLNVGGVILCELPGERAAWDHSSIH